MLSAIPLSAYNWGRFGWGAIVSLSRPRHRPVPTPSVIWRGVSCCRRGTSSPLVAVAPSSAIFRQFAGLLDVTPVLVPALWQVSRAITAARVRPAWLSCAAALPV
jgi:hypothetical protein